MNSHNSYVMHDIDVRRLDLNLLVVLDRLLQERSVSGAARGLAMTQPAVSHALKRLRGWFDDDLLSRRGNAMVLTPRAEALVEPVADVLAQVRALTTVNALPLAAIERTLRLSMVDFATAALLPPLLAELSRKAPGIALACLDWALPDEEIEHVRRGRRDLVLTTVGAAPRDLRATRLGEVDYVGLARRGHPLFSKRPFDPNPHAFVIVSRGGRVSTYLDDAIAPRRRRIAASIPQYLVAPLVAEASDLVVYVPRPLAVLWSPRGTLRMFDAPAELRPQPATLLWHPRHEGDPAHRFVRDQLATLAREALARRR
jgi:DNA-binding transcriptional LysR family regulator